MRLLALGAKRNDCEKHNLAISDGGQFFLGRLFGRGQRGARPTYLWFQKKGELSPECRQYCRNS